MNELDMAVLAARCASTRNLFGMSFRMPQPAQWELYWAFALSELAARREGYENTRLTGKFSIAFLYPGCPYCKNPSFFICHACSHVTCSAGTMSMLTCAWCGKSAMAKMGIDSLQAGSDL